MLDMRFRSNGLFAPTPFGHPSLEVGGAPPRGLLYSGGLWLGGLDSGGQLHFSAHMYGSDGHDFISGPLTTDGSASIDPAVVQQYDRIWRIHGSQVEQHRHYYACLADPECDINTEFPGGYTIPNDFLNWPAMGDVSAGQSLYLAPFYDHDSDGNYDPTSGDHPCVQGDLAMYMIYNDKGQPHLESGGDPFGVEVHMMPFAYISADQELNNTIFIHYRLINRSNGTYNNFHMGIFSDFDIGCSNDDIVGTDVPRNMVYGYNGDDLDEDCLGSTGFQAQPPALGMLVLKGPLMDPTGADDPQDGSQPSFNGSGFGDGMIDNERHGLSGSMHFRRQGNNAQTEPAALPHFYNYLRSIWKDNVPLTYGGNGYSQDPGAVPSDFAFPGDSDPTGVGTGGGATGAWHDMLDPLMPDPKMIATMGPITLEPGEEQEILIAYVYAHSDGGGAYGSVEALQLYADSVLAFAQTIPGLMAGGSVCDGLSVGIDASGEVGTIGLFPNPASHLINIHLGEHAGPCTIEVTDMRGTRVLQRTTSGSSIVLDIAHLAPGPYIIRTSDARSIRIGRFVKE